MAAPVFPAFLKLEHQRDASAKASFLAEVAAIGSDAKRQFEQSFGEIGEVIQRSMSGMKGGQYGFSFDVPGLRKTAADADFAVQRLTAVRDAASNLARTTGDTSGETTRYVQALQAQVREAERAKQIADAQVTTYTRLQAEMDRTVASNERLAQSYRDTFTEQARAANAAHFSQVNVNSLVAPALRSRAVDNGAGFGALEEFARYQEQAVQLRQALDPAIVAQKNFDDEIQRADRLLEAGAISTREYAAAQQLARTNLQNSWSAITAANGAMAQSARTSTAARDTIVTNSNAIRMASLQAGQQLQDIGISLYSGQKAGVVFAQQLPQLAFALSGLEGSTNKTLDRLGKFATFLSGPWGLAVGLAVGVLGSLIAELVAGENETSKAERAQRSFVDVLKDSTSSYQELTKAARDYADQQAKVDETTLHGIQLEASAIATRLQKVIGIREEIKAQLDLYDALGQYPYVGDDQVAVGAALARKMAQAKQAENQSAIDALVLAGSAVTRKAAEAIAAARSGPAETIKAGFDELRRQANETINDIDKLSARLTDLNKQEKAALEAARASKRDARSGVRETAAFASPLPAGSFRQTGTFGEQRPGHRHAGIDLAAPTGTAVSAPYVGVVEAVGFSPTLGKFVVIDHGGGTKTRYGHLSDNSIVQKGDAVEQGDIIGKVGSTGRSTGPHLHYETRVNGKAVNPNQGKFPVDPIHSAEASARAYEKIETYGRAAAEQVQRITEQFDAQPRAIDRAEQATRELKEIMDGLTARDILTPDATKKIEAAKAAIDDYFDRPITEMKRDSERSIQVQNLLSQGREAEADALRRAWQYEDNMQPLTAERKQQILEITQAEEAHNRALEHSRELQSAYLDASRSVRSELEGMFTGRSADFGAIFRQLNARVITEQVFGSMFADLDAWARRNTGLGRATDEFTASTTRAGDAATEFASAAFSAADRLAGINNGSALRPPLYGPANDNAVAGAVGIGASILSAAGLAASLTGGGKLDADGSILVQAAKGGKPIYAKLDRNTVGGMSPDLFAQTLGKGIGDVLGAQLSDLLGPQLARTLGGIAGGAFYGNAVGGAPGAVLGALKGISGLPDGITKALGKGIEGAATGSMISGLANSLGIKMSNTGAQIGGAIGGALPIPGGQIIGSIAGGLLGSVFSSVKKGYAVVSNTGVSVGGNSGSLKDQAQATGEGIQGSLAAIADRLGASIGNYAVSIAQRSSGYIHVSASGSSKVGDKNFTSKKYGADSIYDGKDMEEAIRIAIKNAIEDGAIQGIRAGSQRLLRAAKDIDKGVQDALDFESIFTRLKAINDPIGAALDTLDKEFLHLRDLAVQAGEGMVEVEELYGKERQKIIEQANQQILGSLKNLYSSLTVGDSGLSLRERQANAQAAYDPLRARVIAGDTTAFEDYSAAAQALLDVSRQLYGSQDQYFSIFGDIRDLTKSTIDKQNDIAALATNRDSPFSNSTVPANDNAALVSAIDQLGTRLLDGLGAQLSAINQNMGELISRGSANGTTGISFNYPGGFW